MSEEHSKAKPPLPVRPPRPHPQGVVDVVAAQARADEVIAQVAEPVTVGPLLRVAVTDPVTGQRLATGFVSYSPALAGPHLRLVATR